ncbi:two pore domain potassium channel family protein [Psychrilyobacter piezotolerans]|uniref:Two pore domain potassium channel family protein n=3 Tax=Fusobacteriaceae TaxID=203492 RepID=A0ABX9KG48_9FUSO|nr:two pore domain potassium channel family protein [Psychrilyobacter sp. S5]REI40864.1 two pore domain potassium channel family protein [Psychrilyobacter piezotolerans]
MVRKKMKKGLMNTVILLIISIILGNTLRIDASIDENLKVKMYYSLAIFMNLIPITYFLFKFRVAKKRPIFFMGFIFYYLIILPIWMSFAFEEGMVGKLGLTRDSLTSLKWIIILNLIFLLISQLFIFKYVFVDILSGRRRGKSNDIGIVFLTYITLGIIFGFLYILLIENNPNALGGMILEGLGAKGLYFRGMYFSFITLTSVGYGEIVPISLAAQALTILESVMGVLLLSFSLGIVFSSNLNIKEEQERIEKENLQKKNINGDISPEKYEELKRTLMTEFQDSLDRNIERYMEEKDKK